MFNWVERERLKEMIIEEGTYGFAMTERAMQDSEGRIFGRWFKTRETLLSENPYTNFLLTLKKWPLNEQFVVHSLYFQQVA